MNLRDKPFDSIVGKGENAGNPHNDYPYRTS